MSHWWSMCTFRVLWANNLKHFIFCRAVKWKPVVETAVYLKLHFSCYSNPLGNYPDPTLKVPIWPHKTSFIISVRERAVAEMFCTFDLHSIRCHSDCPFSLLLMVFLTNSCCFKSLVLHLALHGQLIIIFQDHILLYVCWFRELLARRLTK